MREPNPTRLSRLPEGDVPHDVARLFRDARELPDEDLPKLMWRIRASQRRRAMRPRQTLRLVLVVGGVFCLGGFVGAYWGRRPSVMGAPSPMGVAAPVAKKYPSPVRPADPPATLPEPLPAPPAPGAIPEEPRPHLAPPRPRARVAMVAKPALTVEALPAPSPIAAEQELVARALKALRDDRQAQAALAILGEHARQFPNGILRSEASLLRIEALLALGRKDEALSVLDRAPIASAPNRDEQLVLRGELRSSNGRWIEAREDFDEVLRRHADTLAAAAKTRGLQERALWGRASARSRLGDEAGARADLTLYLRLFPNGRFAEWAAKLLKSAP
jgi:hypothetical protein